jgi:DNA-binding transcriptional regulator PaaX
MNQRELIQSRHMARQGVDEDVIRTVRESGRPVRFCEIAEQLEPAGISRSQVHNAVYRLGKKGRIQSSGSGASMTYVVADS